MIKLSRMADYGVILMTQLARENGTVTTAADLSTTCALPLPTVSKLLKALTRAGLVLSERGAQGGYALAKSAQDISAADIIDALEGPVAITTCSASDGRCDLEPVCQVGSAWQRINVNIRAALRDITLDDLRAHAEPLKPLDLRGKLQQGNRLSPTTT